MVILKISVLAFFMPLALILTTEIGTLIINQQMHHIKFHIKTPKSLQHVSILRSYSWSYIVPC